MRPPQRFSLPIRLEPFHGVLADDVQQAEARLTCYLALLSEAGIHESAQPTSASRSNGSAPAGAPQIVQLPQSAATHKDRQAPERAAAPAV